MEYRLTDGANVEGFIQKCENLKRDVRVDFVGIALQADHSKEISWQYAAGNRNEKYRRMLVHYGKGIAGGVIASGRRMVITHFPDGIKGKTIDYPIMLAEHLVSALAVPIFCKTMPKGVLLIGKRTLYSFSETEELVVLMAAKEMEKLLTLTSWQDSRGEEKP
jgi:nitrogen regulatory protein A